MLVLSRRSKQSIVIGGRIKVTVLAITAHQVEIGVEAPLHIAVDREEIHVRKQGNARARAARPDAGLPSRKRPRVEQQGEAADAGSHPRVAVNARVARSTA